MKTYNIEIRTLSPLHLGSGKADILVDAEVVHDSYGLPYFPGRRLKGLLYESALEMAEISQEEWFTKEQIEALFGHDGSSEANFIINNLYIPDYEIMIKDWAYLKNSYPGLFNKESILNSYTELRYQTSIDKETGTTKEGSLHNIRVLDRGLSFVGNIILKSSNKIDEHILNLAIKNLRYAGAKRNRGFGRIQCRVIEKKEGRG